MSAGFVAGEQCWECLRREKPCDGTKPICKACRSVNIVCPGYKNTRPLTWLPTGRVSRLQKSGTLKAARKPRKTNTLVVRSAATTPDSTLSDDQPDSDKASDCSTDPGDAGDAVALVRRGRKPHFQLGDITPPKGSRRAPRSTPTFQIYTVTIPKSIEDEWYMLARGLDVWNQQISSAFDSMAILSSEPPMAIGAIATQSLTPSMRHSFIAIAYGYQLLWACQIHGLPIEPTNSGPVSQLWSRYYRHLGLAISNLNQEIHDNESDNWALIFSSICWLVGAEKYVLSEANISRWRVHAIACLALLKRYKGFYNTMATPLFPFLEVYPVIIAFTVFDTTSPSYDMMEDPFEILGIHDLEDHFKDWQSPIFYCPGPLFPEIVYINRLRAERATRATRPKSPQSGICKVLQRLDDFALDEWLESSPKSEHFSLVSQIFRAAALVYGSIAVPCTSKKSGDNGCRCKELKQAYRNNLFRLIELGPTAGVRSWNIYWPLVVAGVAAHDGTLAEKHIIQEMLSLMTHDPIFGQSPRMASKLLMRFWNSGKTEWDDCFDQPFTCLV
ncbi:Phomenoic acid biosynthesis cluster-specific transcriptional regulator-like protein [Cladobotryum mycophilum]|uniref:Phomenoic acid biosynthesis cluster-specific transcriptional regulator-like protein n=1 Tax=Cladobotryum mycophilum TaxID=491253 RepID=A0ABR0SHC1_9HYPO